MIDVIATRRVRLNGTEYQKGDAVPMSLDEFQALEPTRRFERAPAKPAAKTKTEPKSSDTAD
jgi:hypothetical protein